MIFLTPFSRFSAGEEKRDPDMRIPGAENVGVWMGGGEKIWVWVCGLGVVWTLGLGISCSWLDWEGRRFWDLGRGREGADLGG